MWHCKPLLKETNKLNHTVSMYMLGCALRKDGFIAERAFEDFYKKKINVTKIQFDYHFLYTWLLMCFFHDMGASDEDGCELSTVGSKECFESLCKKYNI